jgi:hypothetical protein
MADTTPGKEKEAVPLLSRCSCFSTAARRISFGFTLASHTLQYSRGRDSRRPRRLLHCEAAALDDSFEDIFAERRVSASRSRCLSNGRGAAGSLAACHDRGHRGRLAGPASCRGRRGALRIDEGSDGPKGPRRRGVIHHGARGTRGVYDAPGIFTSSLEDSLSAAGPMTVRSLARDSAWHVIQLGT